MPLILNGQTGVKITDAAGKIGIGTTNPGSRLTVSRDSEAAEGQIQLRNTGGISAGNYDGIFFTQGAVGQTPLASMRVKYQSNGHPDIGFFTRNLSVAGTEIERVGISNAGYVTMPYQPAFAAGYNGVSTAIAGGNGNGTVIYGNAQINIGNHYNPSTGIFTAPITGLYWFHWTGIKSDSTGSMLNNVSRLDLTHTGTGVPVQLRLDSGQSYDIAGISAVIRLNTNDTARIVKSDNGGLHPSWATFSGFLIG